MPQLLDEYCVIASAHILRRQTTRHKPGQLVHKFLWMLHLASNMPFLSTLLIRLDASVPRSEVVDYLFQQHSEKIWACCPCPHSYIYAYALAQVHRCKSRSWDRTGSGGSKFLMTVITLETIDGFLSCFSWRSRHETDALSFSLKIDAPLLDEIDVLELVLGW